RITHHSSLSLHDALPISTFRDKLHGAPPRSELVTASVMKRTVPPAFVMAALHKERTEETRETDIAHRFSPTGAMRAFANTTRVRSEEHTSELQSQSNLVC